jgi:hypothetical protein
MIPVTVVPTLLVMIIYLVGYILEDKGDEDDR